MPLPNTFLFRELVRSLRINSVDEPPYSLELTRELEVLRKFSLNLLMTFLTVHAISASNALGATTLALLVYTINLHVAINASFLQNSPALSILLHAVPLLGIFCMAVFELVIVVQSPAILAAVLLASALPPFIIAAHLVRQHVKTIGMPFPIQMRDMAPAVPAADTTVVSA